MRASTEFHSGSTILGIPQDAWAEIMAAATCSECDRTSGHAAGCSYDDGDEPTAEERPDHASPTYELTVDGATSTLDDTGLAEWLADTFEPESPEADAVLHLGVGQSYGQNLEGFNAASWLVRRTS